MRPIFEKSMVKLSLADKISLYRIFAAPFLILAIVLRYRELFIALFVISIITDLFDGLLARFLRQESPLGWWLDNVGDFFTFLAALLSLVAFQREFLTAHSFGVSVIVIGLLAQVLVGYWKTKTVMRIHTLLAKTASSLQIIFLLTLFLKGYFGLLFFITAISTVLANIEEIIIFAKYGKVNPNVKGIFWMKGKDGLR